MRTGHRLPLLGPPGRARGRGLRSPVITRGQRAQAAMAAGQGVAAGGQRRLRAFGASLGGVGLRRGRHRHRNNVVGLGVPALSLARPGPSSRPALQPPEPLAGRGRCGSAPHRMPLAKGAGRLAWSTPPPGTPLGRNRQAAHGGKGCGSERLARRGWRGSCWIRTCRERAADTGDEGVGYRPCSVSDARPHRIGPTQPSPAPGLHCFGIRHSPRRGRRVDQRAAKAEISRHRPSRVAMAGRWFEELSGSRQEQDAPARFPC